MKLAVIALLAALLAVVLAPSTSAADISTLPWPEGVVRSVALGRAHAAADVAWLKTVQIMGSDALAQRRWPNLESWVDLTSRLDPAFDLPYFFGAALLVTDAARADKVDVILARGEQALPNEFTFPMMRGFLLQFGKLEPQGAAAHYARAASKPGAPPYLRPYAERLARRETDCASVLRDLKEISQATSSEQASSLRDQRVQIFEHCIAGQLERAATRYRLANEGKQPTVDALVEAGLVPRPPAPPGRCWRLTSLTDGGKATLEPCAGDTTP